MKKDVDAHHEPIPNRIVLTDGFLDQPFVSRFHPGSSVMLSIEPTFEVKENSGLASSTRRTAIEIWDGQLPKGDPEKLAKILFCCDNPPGTKEITGSIDSIGLVYPGLVKATYAGEYWPQSIDHILDEATLKFVEELIYLVPIEPRPADYSVLKDSTISKKTVKNLAAASEACWRAILAQDVHAFGHSVTASYHALVAIFPHMSNAKIVDVIEQYRDQALGWKVSGAGGGGYLLLVSQKPIEHAIRVVARRGR
ncbi:MAG: hypothetical protein ACPGWR_14080 [Ardenticatenaceae bacterium]